MKAVIFDMNGVVINDERFHQQSWRVLIERHPNLFKTPTEDEFTHNIFGRSEKATLEYLLDRPVSQEGLERFSAERVEVVKSLFNPPVLADGLGNLFQELGRKNMPVGIATGSRPNYVGYILDSLDLRQHVQSVVTAEDIQKSKPDPEIYLKTAQALGIEPKDCVVFEDTISGIRAGLAAGMHVIAIASTHMPHELTLADEVIQSFNQVKLLEGRTLGIESVQQSRPKER